MVYKLSSYFPALYQTVPPNTPSRRFSHQRKRRSPRFCLLLMPPMLHHFYKLLSEDIEVTQPICRHGLPLWKGVAGTKNSFQKGGLKSETADWPGSAPVRVS